MQARLSIVTAATALALCLGGAPAFATNLIGNGGFEDSGGSLNGWTVEDQASDSTGSFFLQSGTASPFNGFSVPAPPGPAHAAMSDQNGPGSHLLFQDFVVPTGVTSATLSMQLFISNAAGVFINGPGLDSQSDPNQQARVDILVGSPSDDFTVGGDVLQNIFQTNPGDPLTSGYDLVTADLTSLLQANEGQTLRLRFAEVDNQQFFNLGIDEVSLDVNANQVPEPMTLALFGAGLAGLGVARRRRKD